MDSIFKHSLAEGTVQLIAVEYRVLEDRRATTSDAVMEGL